jgi:hypothetical protein
VISATENSNKFQKTWFCKENSVEDMVKLGPMAQATLVISKFRGKFGGFLNIYIISSMPRI